MKKQTSQLAALLLLTLVVGGLSGVITSVFTNQSINRYIESLATEGQLVRLSEERPRPLPGTYEEALQTVRESSLPGTAFVSPVHGTDILHRVPEDTFVGSGAVVTSDGWLLFHEDAFRSFNDPITEAEVWIGERVYEITNVVTSPAAPVTMVRVQGDTLKTLAFGASEQTPSGAMLFTPISSEGLSVTSVIDTGAVYDTILPAEVHATLWKLPTESVQPVPVFNTLGELVALEGSTQRVIPIDQVLPFVRGTLRGDWSLPALGVYVTYQEALQIDGQTLTEGALVTRNGNSSAVRPSGSAASAGIKEGDVITAVNGLSVDKKRTLAHYLADFAVGDTVTLTVDRSGEVVELPVSLGAYTGDIY